MKMPTAEWIKSAHDDLLVVNKILGNEALTHMVAFYSQQGIEKSFKVLADRILSEVEKVLLKGVDVHAL